MRAALPLTHRVAMSRARAFILLLLPVLCATQFTQYGSDDEFKVEDTIKRLPDHHLHPFLRQKIQEIDLMMRQAKLVYGDYDVQDSLHIRIINPSLDELTRSINASSSVIQTFGNVNVLVEDNLLTLHDHGGYINVEFTSILPYIEGFRSVKKTQIADATLVLFTFADRIEMYSSPNGGNWSSVTHTQRLTNNALKPIATEFIHCLGGVYLAAAFANKFGGSVNSLIYQWTGSYMDEIHELPTAGAVDLAVIAQSDHFYVAIAEKKPSNAKDCVTIYKITPDAPYRMHRIFTNSPTRLLPYMDFQLDDRNYLLVLNDGNGGTVLKLEGDEFVQHHNIVLPSAPDVASIGYLEAVPVLISAHGNSISMARLSPEGLFLELKTSVEGSAVSMLELVEAEYGKYMVVATSATKKRLFITVINMAVRRNILVHPPKLDPVQLCMKQLTDELDSRQRTIDQLKAKINMVENAEDVTFDGVLFLPHEIELTLSTFNRLVIETSTQFPFEEKQIMAAARQLVEGIEKLEKELPNLVYKDKPIVIDYPIVVDGDFRVKKLEADAITVKKLNGDDFSEKHFIMSQPELDIEDGQFVEELHVVNLDAPDIFLPGILENPTVKSLKANNIIIPRGETINGIDLDQVVLRDYEGVIEGKKVFDDLVTDNAYIDNFNGVDIEKALNGPPQIQRLNTTGDVEIQDLTVEKINGIDIKQFMNDVFLKGIHDTIEGDIIVNGLLEIEDLYAEHFQGIPAQDMLTKTTDQIITANVTVDDLTFEYGQVGLLNGMNLSNVALLSKHNIITSPVTISNLNIENDLILNCDEKKSKYCGIVNLSPEDLVQVYEGPVVIDGSLTVDDLHFSKEAYVTVNDEPFHTDFEKVFWMKTKKQRIPDGVTFAAGLTVPRIDASSLNGVPLEDYATVNTDFTDISVEFDELRVDGDFLVQPGTECAAIVDLGRDVVTSFGDVVITGKKKFMDKVLVKHLNAEMVNDVEVNNIVLLNETREKEFLGDITVEDIEVKGNLITNCDIQAKLVNDYPLKRIVNRALRLDQDAYLESVTFTKPLEATNILVESGPLADTIKKIDTLFEGINVTVAGELNLKNGVNEVKYINGIEFESYIGQVVNKNVGGLVAGKKIFSKGLKVDQDFDAEIINGINFPDLMKYALRKNGDQIITGEHRIKNLYAENCYLSYLNNISVDNIVDASEPIVINSSLIFENINVYGQLDAESPVDLKAFKESINDLKPRCWDEVEIDGDINWEVPGAIDDIIEGAVHGYHENVITGNVIFKGPLAVNNLETNEFIDGVDIQQIARDAVMKSSPEQVISGKKIFMGPVTIKKLFVEQGLYSENISSFDLQYINDSLARKNEDNYFEGHITFKGNISAEVIEATNIKGIPPLEDIVTIDNVKHIDNIQTASLHLTGDLIVENINGMKFNKFLESIILLDGDTQHVNGTIEFEDIQVDSMVTNTINNVNASDIIFDNPTKEIEIQGDVTFGGDINIEGNAEINKLNDVDLNDAFKKTIWANDDIVIEGNLKVPGESVFEEGIFGKIDGVDVRHVINKELSNIEANVDETIERLRKIDTNLSEKKTNYENLGPNFLYLELVKYTDLKLQDVLHLTATCSPSSCEFVTASTNLDCLQLNEPCTICSTEREMEIDTTDWRSNIKKEVINQRRFLISDVSNAEIANIVTSIKNDGTDCRIQTILQWTSPLLFEDEDYPNLVTNLSEDIPLPIPDVKFVALEDVIVVFIGQNSGVDNVESSVVLVLDPEERTVLSQYNVPSCGVRHVACVGWSGEIHLFLGNTRTCGGFVYKWTRDAEHLTQIQSEEVIIGLISAGVSNTGTPYVVFSTVDKDESMTIEMSYSKESNRYVATQSIRLGPHSVIGLELATIYGLRTFETVLCVATSDGLIQAFKKSKKGWSLQSSGHVDGATGLAYLKGSSWPYLLVTSSKSSAVISLTSMGI